MLSSKTLLDVLHKGRFGVVYEPIVCTQEQITYAYEALARFTTADGQKVPPDQIFRALHTNKLLLYQVELEMKHLQLQNASPHHTLFLNMDPDAFAVMRDEGDVHPLVQMFTDNRQTVIEIIENTSVSDAKISENMIQAFAKHKVPIALDDIGAPNSLLSLSVLMDVEYLKFDRSWVQRFHVPGYLEIFNGLIKYAEKTGKKTILEGVETEADLMLARHMGADYVQGFYFRDQFVEIPGQETPSMKLHKERGPAVIPDQNILFEEATPDMAEVEEVS
ncbi:MAG: EAL domain-containing protein [Magnetococcales bacterium]|nr:EAL domain-containing protein [Magnetococcales bacterium]